MENRFPKSVVFKTDPVVVDGNWIQVLKQFAAVGAVAAFAFAGTMIIGKIIDKTLGLRVKQVDEIVGLDISQHGERAYGGLMR